MAKRKTQTTETDSKYFLKVVIYVVMGSLWLKFNQPIHIGDFAVHGFPLGLILGLMIASHDHFAIDRKIEYALLVVVTIVSFFLPSGIVV